MDEDDCYKWANKNLIFLATCTNRCKDVQVRKVILPRGIWKACACELWQQWTWYTCIAVALRHPRVFRTHILRIRASACDIRNPYQSSDLYISFVGNFRTRYIHLYSLAIPYCGIIDPSFCNYSHSAKLPIVFAKIGHCSTEPKWPLCYISRDVNSRTLGIRKKCSWSRWAGHAACIQFMVSLPTLMTAAELRTSRASC